MITIRVGAPQDLQTRVTYEADANDENKLSVKWQQSDKIVINGNVFTVSSLGEDGGLAEFTGTDPGAGPYTIFYAGNGAEAKTMETILAQDYSCQTQPSNDATSHLWFAAKLTGVDTYEDIVFSSDWAAEHSGSYQQSGAVRLKIQKPEGVTSVKSVTLTAPGEVFFKDNALSEKTKALTVTFDGGADVSGNTHIIAYAMLPWSNVSLPAGDYQIAVMTPGYDVYLKTKTLDAATLESTSVNVFKLNKTGFSLQRYAGGSGVEGDPWLIGNATHMVHMSEDGVNGSIKHFKMIADVNMSSVTAASWTPYNVVSGYTKGIVFDGDNHTVSNFTMAGRSGVNYMSVFGILNGTIKNVTFHNCSITSTQASPLGLVAGWAGTSGASIKSTWQNVHATNCAVTSNYKTNNVGGLAGSADGSTFTNCSFDGTVTRGADYAETGYRYLGGLVGGIPADTGLTARVTFSGCSTSGSISDPNPSLGGILGGMHNNAATTMDDCHSTMNISTGAKVAGGLIGYTGGATVTNSSYDGTITSTLAENAYVAGIVSYCYHFVNISNCTSAGTINADASSAIIGGITGGLNPQEGDTNDIIISNCTSSMNITGGMKIGGILGITPSNDYGGNRTISGCTYSGTLTAKALDSVSTNDNKNTTYAGGIVGFSRKMTVENCSVTGTVKSTVDGYRVGGIAGYAYSVDINGCQVSGNVTTPNGNHKGGIVGYAETVHVENCLVSGNVTTKGGELKGGLVGYLLGTNSSIKKSAFTGEFTSTGGNHCGGVAGRADAGSVIEDCYASGNFTGNGQRQGGILGNGAVGNVTVRRCYVSGTSLLNKGFGTGGIIGYAQDGNSVAGTHGNINVTVEKCIVWCSSITVQSGSTSQWGSGAIVGSIGGTNTLADCYRKPDMTLSYNCANSNWPKLYDQENASPSAQLTYYNGAAEAPATCQSPYHGKSAERAWTDAGETAPATITISALAQQIGWPSSVWDFSGDTPVLK